MELTIDDMPAMPDARIATPTGSRHDRVVLRAVLIAACTASVAATWVIVANAMTPDMRPARASRMLPVSDVLLRAPAPGVDPALDRVLIVGPAMKQTIPVLVPERHTAKPAAASKPRRSDAAVGSGRVPTWVIKGIARIETSSYWKDDGTFVYVDKRRGAHGERGPFQVKRIAFEEVAEPGERYADIEHDMAFARSVTERILLELRPLASSWRETVAIYNAGPSASERGRRAGRRYADRVDAYGNGRSD